PLQLPALAGWVVFTFLFAAIGAFATSQAGTFYAQLDRPEWAPPAWLFGPAWTVLYALMAVAAWRVYRTASIRSVRPELTLYVVQLVLNALWSWLFFAWHNGPLAFAEIIVLWLAIAATIVAFRRRDRLAGLLLLPYIAWVTFAGALCYSIWQRNPALLG
ncbi:TspO/MBR family protein, partial [Duganella phyllosphaerae]|uniref:TspO/MBR family protein n=1 Tax=Duganella phyllosphaerae TaxID=762836 RepID=UPI000A3FB555